MDPDTNLYKRVKEGYLSGKIKESVHRGFCDFIEQLFKIKVLDCDLTRLSHNNKLRLEIIILDNEDLDKIIIGDSCINLRKINELREEYKKVISQDSKVFDFYKELNVNEIELENLFLVVSSFLDKLRWDLNINLDKRIEKDFFDKHLGIDQYRINKEFEIVLILLRGSKKKEDYDFDQLEEISVEYNILLDKSSPIKGLFKKIKVHCFFENEKEYLEKYGNFRNYLN